MSIFRKKEGGEEPAKTINTGNPALFLAFPLTLFYLELIFHLSIFKSLSPQILLLLPGSLALGSLLELIRNISSRAFVRKGIAILLTILCVLFFWIHLIYHQVFVTFWAPFSTLAVAGQAFDYMGMILDNMQRSTLSLLLLALPLPLRIALCFLPENTRRQSLLGSLPLLLLSVGSALLLLFAGGRSAGSVYDLALQRTSISESMQKLGVIATTLADANPAESKVSLYTPDQKTPAPTPTPSVNKAKETVSSSLAAESNALSDNTAEEETLSENIVYSANIMDIPFEELAAQHSDAKLQAMDLYFAAQEPSMQNAYTGMFEGYNLIWITAEAMSRFIIDEERTPTLYRLANEGFVFDHFYTPLWYGSTSGGEWAALTGTSPGNGGYLSMQHSGSLGTNMYFTPGIRLGELGYQCSGFHANYADYYKRNLSHPNMGLQWIAYGSGFKPEMRGSNPVWPQSDLLLWQQSMDYIDFEQPFFAYYMTISGHAQYNWGGNSMSARHKDLFGKLPYSENTNAYLACQYETELMLEQMLKDLEEKGVLDKSVIVLCADHIPYNDKYICDELAGHELDDQTEWFENSLIIWSASMEDPIPVEKYCSSIDILPTVLNLFGIEYDSRLLGGRDILSDSPQLVYFNGSNSFISDRCIYNAKEKSITPFSPYTADDITEDYLKEMQEIIRSKAQLSTLIINNDYYEKLFGED